MSRSLNVGSIGYATRQGLGHLMKWFFDAGVITSPAVFRHSHPSRQTHMDWYPPGTMELIGRPFARHPGFLRWLEGLDVLIAFETFFDWEIVNQARQIGVKTILMPMHEWTNVRWPAKPDAVMCPSRLDYDYFKDEFPSSCCRFIPVPVQTECPACDGEGSYSNEIVVENYRKHGGRKEKNPNGLWVYRTSDGQEMEFPSVGGPCTVCDGSGTAWKLRKRADRFLHNAGNIGHREHKGTRQLLEAIPLVRSTDFRLTVRAQDTKALRSILDGCPQAEADLRVTFEMGEVDYGRLFGGHDVYVAPEKLNGLSLPLQEACAAGLMVMTTDRYPANTWLPSEPLIPAARTERARIGSSYREFDESIVEPAAIAATIDRWVGQDITKFSLSGRDWATENSWEKLKPVYDEFIAGVCR